MTDSDHESSLTHYLGDRITIGGVLEGTESPDDPLHGFFEWDDTKAADAYQKIPKEDGVLSFSTGAADAYRIIQARKFLREAGYLPKGGCPSDLPNTLWYSRRVYEKSGLPSVDVY